VEKLLFWGCIIFIALAVWLILDTQTDGFGDEKIPVSDVTVAPSSCENSTVWECRKCDRQGRLMKYGGNCLCKFCVNGEKKTVENDADLRHIYCFDASS
jgi:hypothetical protein